MQKYKIHVFRPTNHLKNLVRKFKHIEGVDGFVEDYAFTAEYSDRVLATEVTARAKQVFLADMAINYPEFFRALGFRRQSATSIVDELWEYLEFENCGGMSELWKLNAEKFKESASDWDFIDPDSWEIESDAWNH
ncbi:hypothetical protein [Chitinimonas lacunae]|uniref:Uncharacterized protein n=1 Tax=Chitinimonas lacunae TaxID=1963018 RepID=A0ABV8MV64_9NEIS